MTLIRNDNITNLERTIHIGKNEFEDSKGVIWIRKSNEDRQHYGQKK
jgi:hypothetical protein